MTWKIEGAVFSTRKTFGDAAVLALRMGGEGNKRIPGRGLWNLGPTKNEVLRDQTEGHKAPKLESLLTPPELWERKHVLSRAV